MMAVSYTHLWFAMTAGTMHLGDTMSTVLYQGIAERFGTEYTVEWSVDKPDILSLSPSVSETGEHKISFTALDYGNAVITCTATWPDGTVRKCYCSVYVIPES